MGNTQIYVPSIEESLIPHQFSDAAVVRGIAGLNAVYMYTELRVRGHGTVDSFCTAFGNHFIGHPDAISSAAEAFESSEFFGRICRIIMKETSAHELRNEWKQRANEFSVMTNHNAAELLFDQVEDQIGRGQTCIPFEYTEHLKIADCAVIESLVVANDSANMKEHLSGLIASNQVERLDGLEVVRSETPQFASAFKGLAINQ